MNNSGIDRNALVTRHSPRYSRPEFNAPLSVGNGRFCFTVDITGLQTFTGLYRYFPLCTMADWGWHSYPGENQNLRDLRLVPFDTWGREVGYPIDGEGQEELYHSLRQNPHRFNLASLGLDIPGEDLAGSGVPIKDLIGKVNQRLDLWEGVIYSSFELWGERVLTETLVHPGEDTVCVRLRSTLLETKKLKVRLKFPYGSYLKDGSDFASPERHETRLKVITQSHLVMDRSLDCTGYTVEALLGENAGCRQTGAHCFVFESSGDFLTLVLRFDGSGNLPEPGISAALFFDQAKSEAGIFWEQYWTEGGAIDLSGSASSGAPELERRVVLSQYLQAIQNRGSFPPAETGLSCNSWYGKFHLEMIYWHSAQYALWNRTGILEKTLAWYKDILPRAKQTALSQGYEGARWPKMCGPSGGEGPSPIGPLLIWQQPHPILLAELCYRQNQSRAFLAEYRELVVESAVFMRSFIHWDRTRFVLGPPLIPAQERFDPRTVFNPGYEVEYFRWAFGIANAWLRRLNEKERPDFFEAGQKLAFPAIYEGVFPAHEKCPHTFTQTPFNTDHPSMLGMLGLLPGSGLDPRVMNNTLDRVLRDWDMDSTWGWDFPMMAMTAARLGRGDDAVRLLLLENPKNTYLPNGHNPQADRDDLPLYLPGNGGLLLAAAMMAAGWDNDDGSHAPGFPGDGSYQVRFENLRKYI